MLTRTVQARALIEGFRNRNLQQENQADVHSVLQESLRIKVASLEDDRWMYEAEQGESG